MDKFRAITGGRGALCDEVWFNALFDRYYQPVRNYAFRLLDEIEAAQEVAQDVFVRLWEKGGRGEPEATLRSFLFTAAHNLCVDRIRSDRAMSEYRKKIGLKYSAAADSFMDELISSDLRERLEEQIDALPAQCGRAFRMSRIDNLKYKEIADRMGISVKTVEAHVSRAIAILREKLGRDKALSIFLLFF